MARYSSSKPVFYMEIPSENGEPADVYEIGSSVTLFAQIQSEFLEMGLGVGDPFITARPVKPEIRATFAFQCDPNCLEPIFFPNNSNVSEWRCPYCSHINHSNFFTCGEGDLGMGCGHPKTKVSSLVHE